MAVLAGLDPVNPSWGEDIRTQTSKDTHTYKTKVKLVTSYLFLAEMITKQERLDEQEGHDTQYRSLEPWFWQLYFPSNQALLDAS